MRNYQHVGFDILDRYDIFYGGDEKDAGVVSGHRRRILNFYGFPFSTTLGNEFLKELCDSVVFSVVQMVMEFERIG
jgi:hypothetical protein